MDEEAAIVQVLKFFFSTLKPGDSVSKVLNLKTGFPGLEIFGKILKRFRIMMETFTSDKTIQTFIVIISFH